MIRKINRYLVTHYPLIWNTRAHWVLLFNIILYLLFFTAGHLSIQREKLGDYWGISDVGGSNLMVFSVLCSIAVLIGWLIFYLRNNAFKAFYRIGRFYLAKEFFLILVIVFSSIIYFEAFHAGVRSGIRKLAPLSIFTQEVNTVNNGLAFIPHSKPHYFILNNCTERKKPGRKSVFLDPSDRSPDDEVLDALRRPDAFSYKNYCIRQFAYDSYAGIFSDQALADKRMKWIADRNTDSISNAIEQVLRICDKYGIDYKLNRKMLVSSVFADDYNSVKRWIAPDEYDYESEQNRPEYIGVYHLNRTFGLVNEAYRKERNYADRNWTILLEIYTALSLSILLLLYRRVSRKAFLFCIIGSILWLIAVIFLIMLSGTEKMISIIPILLCIAFLLAAIAYIKSNSSKTLSGMLLGWHSILLPYFFVFIINFIEELYQSRFTGIEMTQEKMAEYYPFLSFVRYNVYELHIANLVFSVLYIAFVFNALAKKQASMSEE